jgi:hypothetical protein
MRVGAVVTALLALPAVAQAWEVTGFAAAEGRYFPQSPAHAGQKQGSGMSAILQPEFYHKADNGNDSFTFTPFLRLDRNDSDRSHADIRELSWVHTQHDWEVMAGVGKVFWGVIETKHVVDIINQTDAVEDIDGEDKLGQPMLQAALFRDWGTLRGFVMPYFRERTFPGRDGRLRPPLPIAADHARYEHTLAERAPDLALRYTHTLDGWDIGVAHFHGTGREPRLVQGQDGGGNPALIPVYDRIDQTSLDLQLTQDAWLYKLEAATRSGQGERFNALSAGVEYTLYQIADTNADLGLLTEYHRDDRSRTKAPFMPLDDDVFLGFRLTLNDVDDTTLLAGVMVDKNDKDRALSAEFSKRVGQNWKIELDARFYFAAAAPASGLNAIRADDHLILRLSRYF